MREKEVTLTRVSPIVSPSESLLLYRTVRAIDETRVTVIINIASRSPVTLRDHRSAVVINVISTRRVNGPSSVSGSEGSIAIARVVSRRAL